MYFLNKSDLSDTFDEVYLDLNKVPLNTIKFEDDFRKSYDGCNFLNKSDLYKYVFESFKDIQPKSYQQLIKGKFFYAIDREPYEGSPSDITQFGILVNDRAFYIKYTQNCFAIKPKHFNFFAVPDFIIQSWFYSSDR